ncbi:hypothetical protein H920_03589 [Fukomys damarensis]|uniref:Uncharacterized protein n=1 Tax=Fukomys damarensis TaxID=885580 RepID=A0A091DUX0_FUKDA|nr:hypothetical protein H920_03589 [Fukomys damarensis]
MARAAARAPRAPAALSSFGRRRKGPRATAVPPRGYSGAGWRRLIALTGARVPHLQPTLNVKVKPEEPTAWKGRISHRLASCGEGNRDEPASHRSLGKPKSEEL